MINLRDKRFEFYDAMPSQKNEFGTEVLGNLRRWVCDEAQHKFGKIWDLKEWTDHRPNDIPCQQNGYDCGMFAIKYAQCVALDLDLQTNPFTQQHIAMFRRRAVYEMMQNKITV